MQDTHANAIILCLFDAFPRSLRISTRKKEKRKKERRKELTSRREKKKTPTPFISTHFHTLHALQRKKNW